VVASLLERFESEVRVHIATSSERPPVEPMLVAEVVEISGDTAVVDDTFAAKQPDWSYDDEDSGQWPAERFADHRVG
jgi:hypothetical protein